MEETVTPDQFTQILSSRGKEWVRGHCPTTLAEANSLMEEYVTAEGSEMWVHNLESLGSAGESGGTQSRDRKSSAPTQAICNRINTSKKVSH